MTPRDRRSRLLGKSKPNMRPAILVREDGYGEDMGVLWAAYRAGSFPLIDQNLDMAAFAKLMIATAATLHEMAIVEDDCKTYPSGRGPVAVIGIRSDGWKHEPHIDYFKWATPRIILRVSVQFFQMARHSREVGVCVVRSLKATSNLFLRISKDYGVLNFVGRIPHGTPRGDEWVFSTMGRKELPKKHGEMAKAIAA